MRYKDYVCNIAELLYLSWFNMFNMQARDFKIEWPEINFSELWDCYIENKFIRTFYKTLLAILFLPEIAIAAFYEILKFKG